MNLIGSFWAAERSRASADGHPTSRKLAVVAALLAVHYRQLVDPEPRPCSPAFVADWWPAWWCDSETGWYPGTDVERDDLELLRSGGKENELVLPSLSTPPSTESSGPAHHYQSVLTMRLGSRRQQLGCWNGLWSGKRDPVDKWGNICLSCVSPTHLFSGSLTFAAGFNGALTSTHLTSGRCGWQTSENWAGQRPTSWRPELTELLKHSFNTDLFHPSTAFCVSETTPKHHRNGESSIFS